MEHFSIYNKRRPSESYTISVRMGLGHLNTFFTTPFAPSVAYFSVLESRIIAFHKTFKNLFFRSPYQKAKSLGTEIIPHSGSPALSRTTSAEALNGSSLARTAGEMSPVSNSEIDDALYLDYVYITDELIYFGLLDTYNHFIFLLANIHFSRLFHHDIFRSSAPACLSKRGGERTWQPPLRRWITRFALYLSLFPYDNDSLSQLRELLDSLVVKDRKPGSL
eukprot:Sdes_comp20726_c0_seq1m16518